MEIIIVRHGLSVANKTRMTGGDTDLTPEGRQQAQGLAARLDGLEIDAIYCSPLKRTQQTAAPLVAKLGLEPQIDNRLTEVNWGDFDGEDESVFIQKIGLTPRDSLDTYAYDFRKYHGESAAQVEARVKSFLDELKQKPHNLALIVSHGGIVRWLHYLITGEKITWQPNAEELHLKSS